jgi:hypothetical protein
MLRGSALRAPRSEPACRGSCPIGFDALLAIYFPGAAPEEFIEGHRQHLAVEFTNWITTAAESLGRTSNSPVPFVVTGTNPTVPEPGERRKLSGLARDFGCPGLTEPRGGKQPLCGTLRTETARWQPDPTEPYPLPSKTALLTPACVRAPNSWWILTWASAGQSNSGCHGLGTNWHNQTWAWRQCLIAWSSRGTSSRNVAQSADDGLARQTQRALGVPTLLPKPH